jgi:hypothetical protein
VLIKVFQPIQDLISLKLQGKPLHRQKLVATTISSPHTSRQKLDLLTWPITSKKKNPFFTPVVD